MGIFEDIKENKLTELELNVPLDEVAEDSHDFMKALGENTSIEIVKFGGDFTGDLMRRGLIMVEGDIGDYCASRMIAGTITNLGAIGKQVGVGMRRGTLLLPHKPEDMSKGFKDCGRHNLGFLTLLLHELRRYESRFQSLHPMRRRVQVYEGDMAVGGQAEILIWIG